MNTPSSNPSNPSSHFQKQAAFSTTELAFEVF